ncbi:hypothetical protein B0H14DRAFT_2680106, partial [Mycena olivaceomarginata]
MPFLFLSLPSARAFFRTAVTVFLTLWFLAYPFVTYCTGLTVEERSMELSIRQYYAFARLQELHAPQVLRLRYLDENDPQSTIFVEVAPPSSFSHFLTVDAPPLFKPTTTRVADAVNIKVDASLVSAPRPGSFPVHGHFRALPFVFGLSAVVVFVLVGVVLFIKTAIQSTTPFLVLAVHQFDPTCKTTQGEAADVTRVVVAEDEPAADKSYVYDLAEFLDIVSCSRIVNVAAFLSSDDLVAAAAPEPVITATELDFGDVSAPVVNFTSSDGSVPPAALVLVAEDVKRGEHVSMEPDLCDISAQVLVLTIPDVPASTDSTPVMAVALVENAERGSRPDRERVCTEVEAMSLRISGRTRKRTAPGHPLLPVSMMVPGAAVSRILPLPPMPVVQRPAPAPVSSCSRFACIGFVSGRAVVQPPHYQPKDLAREYYDAGRSRNHPLPNSGAHMYKFKQRHLFHGALAAFRSISSPTHSSTDPDEPQKFSTTVVLAYLPALLRCISLPSLCTSKTSPWGPTTSYSPPRRSILATFTTTRTSSLSFMHTIPTPAMLNAARSVR